MNHTLHRLKLCGEVEGQEVPGSLQIRPYHPVRHHRGIREVYGRAFGEDPWPDEWDRFEEFDSNGAFVAEDSKTGEAVGYVLSFRRRNHGYISVVAVVPELQRRGVGGTLVQTAVRYLRELGLETVRIDAFTDADAAVGLYLKVGFEIERTFADGGR